MKFAKVVRVFILVAFWVTLSLGVINLVRRPVNTDQSVILTPSPTSSGGSGFGGIVTELPKRITVREGGEKFPVTLKTHQVLPAPFALFSEKAAQVIAQNLGFTQEASAYLSGNLYIYRQGTKLLTINKLAGTIDFSEDWSKLGSEPDLINEASARTQLRIFFKGLGLDQEFFDWTNARVTAYLTSDGEPRKTDNSSPAHFLEFVPDLKVGDYSLDLPMPIFVRIGKDNSMIGLSFWYPNFDWENPREVELLSFAEAKRRVQKGEGLVIAKTLARLDSVSLEQTQLVYRVLPEYWSDFSLPHFLEPTFVFEGKEAKVYLKAIE